MSRINVFFAEGYEEIEALMVVDLCRRAGIEVVMTSVTEERQVMGSHHILVQMDACLSEVDFTKTDMIVLPGGLKGTAGLENTAELMGHVDAFYKDGKYIAAICAAPSIFGHRGMLKGRKACCYPDFESHLDGALVSREEVCISDHVITSRGMGTALNFGLAIVSVLCGQEEAESLARKIVYDLDKK